MFQKKWIEQLLPLFKKSSKIIKMFHCAPSKSLIRIFHRALGVGNKHATLREIQYKRPWELPKLIHLRRFTLLWLSQGKIQKQPHNNTSKSTFGNFVLIFQMKLSIALFLVLALIVILYPEDSTAAARRFQNKRLRAGRARS